MEIFQSLTLKWVIGLPLTSAFSLLIIKKHKTNKKPLLNWTYSAHFQLSSIIIIWLKEFHMPFTRNKCTGLKKKNPSARFLIIVEVNQMNVIIANVCHIRLCWNVCYVILSQNISHSAKCSDGPGKIAAALLWLMWILLNETCYVAIKITKKGIICLLWTSL